MTAVVILNILFAAFVVLAMLTLLGHSIVKHARETGQTVTPPWQFLRVRPGPRFARSKWSGEPDAAMR